MDIESLLARNEGKDLDFKEKLEMSSEKKIKKDDLVKDISAIANSVETKGWLIYGVKDKSHDIVGITNPLNEEKIQQVCAVSIDPPIDLEIKNITYKDKNIGIISITPTDKPHQIIKETGDLKKSKIYVRRGSVNDEATPEEIHSFLKQRRVINKDDFEKIYDLFQRKKMFFILIYQYVKEHEKGYFQSWLQEVNKNINNTKSEFIKFLVKKEYKYLVKKSDEKIFNNLFSRAGLDAEYYTEDLLEEEKIMLIYFRKYKCDYDLVKKSTANYIKEVRNYLFENSKFNKNKIDTVQIKLKELNLEIDNIINKIA